VLSAFVAARRRMDIAEHEKSPVGVPHILRAPGDAVCCDIFI
jgi:hypothetical protein